MANSARLSVTRPQAVAYRLAANHLADRLPAGSLVEAAHVGLQDSAPRDGLLGLHARVAGVRAEDWQHESLIQTYSPRAAVYLLPRADLGIFTVGRLPLDLAEIRRIDQLADEICRDLDGREGRGDRAGLRAACPSGRLVVRWTTSALWFREVPRPAVDPDVARRELCRRHVHRFGPTSPRAFAWWSGLSPRDARQVWDSLADELLAVDLDGVPAWIRRADETAVRTAPAPRGVRLLVAPDLRLLGRDRLGRFVGPGQRAVTPAADTFHPNGLLVDGRIVGAWGRRGGRVEVRLSEPISAAVRAALQDEVERLPVPRPQVLVAGP